MAKRSGKVIFFDIGGVLLTNGWGHESRQKAAEQFGIDYNKMDYLHDFIFNIYEIGKITLDDYLDWVVFNEQREFSRVDFKAFMFSQSVELPDMLQWLKKWKSDSGYTILSVNNEGRELNQYRIKTFGLHECFDGFISSCEVGMRKPDPGIFQLAMGIAQLPAADCLYFDDRKVLVEAAANCGLNSHQHKGFESTKAILESLTHE